MEILTRVSSPSIINVLRLNLDDSAFRHRLPRIEKDVMEYLADLARIDLRGPEILVDVNVNARPVRRRVPSSPHPSRA